MVIILLLKHFGVKKIPWSELQEQDVQGLRPNLRLKYHILGQKEFFQIIHYFYLRIQCPIIWQNFKKNPWSGGQEQGVQSFGPNLRLKCCILGSKSCFILFTIVYLWYPTM